MKKLPQKKRLAMDLERLLRGALQPRGMATLSGGLAIGLAGGAWAELPVPCAADCGAALKSFVQSGVVNAPVISGQNMSIRQKSDKAILNWKSFNISSDAKVKFEQNSSTSVALNRIYQGDPSQILGSLSANGQIYLVNPNGFVFGANARVNANSMVLSTLDIRDELFLGKSIAAASVKEVHSNAIADGNAALLKTDANGLSTNAGAIQIENGAKLQVGDAGRIMLVAEEISNAGELRTGASGQVIAAASKNHVYVMPSEDENLRGFLVEVDQGGVVENTATGRIIADRGNITAVGAEIHQNGEMTATTSATENGSIVLAARHGTTLDVQNGVLDASTGGSVELGGSSITRVVNGTQFIKKDGDGRVRLDSRGKPLYDSKYISSAADAEAFLKKTVDSLAQKPSTVHLEGKSISLRSGAKVAAKGGKVELVAASDPANLIADGTRGALKPVDALDQGASVVLERGSSIDVSGNSEVLDMSRNLIEVDLYSNELKDSPLQKKGPLYRQTVTVDIRKGTPLADISDKIAGIEKSVDERTASGGSVAISSTGAVRVASGSSVDVSGGAINYRAGSLATTQLRQGDRLVDISEADPNQHYDGIEGQRTAHSQKWGTEYAVGADSSKRYARQEAAYSDGQDAGTLSLAARDVVLEGDLRASTTRGVYQRTASNAPLGGKLELGLVSPMIDALENPNYLGPDIALWASPGDLPGSAEAAFNLQVQGILGDAGLAGLLPASGLNLYQNSLSQSGFTRLSLNSNGSVALGSRKAYARQAEHLALQASRLASAASGDEAAAYSNAATRLNQLAASLDSAPEVASAPLHLATLGSLNVQAGRVDLGTDIQGAGASVSLSAKRTLDYLSIKRPALTVADGVGIDVSGNWSNDRAGLANALPDSLIALDAGSISLSASSGGTLSLPGSLSLRADGGAWQDQKGKLREGKGGNISLEAKTDKNAAGGATLELRGTSGLSLSSLGSTGGALRITAPNIDVGQRAGADIRKGAQGQLDVGDGVFNALGFSSVALAAQGGALNIAEDARISASQKLRRFSGDLLRADNGADLRRFSSVETPRAHEQRATSLSLSQLSSGRADNPVLDLLLGEHASITASDQGSISLKNDTGGQLRIAGDLQARAGKIALEVDRDGERTGAAFDPSLMLWLGPKARVDASGSFKPSLNNQGLTTGSVLNGGQVSLISNGYVVLDSGSTVDVSGRAHAVDLDAEYAPGSRTPGGRATLAGAGGKVAIAAGEGLVWRGDIRGSGAAGGAGGTLEIAHGERGNYANLNMLPPAPRVIEISNAGGSLPAGFNLDAATPLPDADYNGYIRLGKSQLESSGFDTLSLSTTGVVALKGDLDLHMARELDLLTGAIELRADGAASHATLSADRVVLGGGTSTIARAPVTGENTLSVSADLLDLDGSLSIGGTREVALNSSGDVRLSGQGASLLTNRGLSLNARQVYPTTLVNYTLAVLDARDGGGGLHTGQLSIASAGQADAAAPSAAGALHLRAHDISQTGRLKAPQGALDLRAEGVSYDADNAVLVASGDKGILNLAAGSTTSVSGQGQTVLVGRLDGNRWVDYTTSRVLADASGSVLPERNISLEGASVQVAKGATVDLSSSGSMRAWDFVEGPGGSSDLLNDTSAFAILPGKALDYLPYDRDISQSGVRVGDTVYLAGAEGVPAGEYAVLPARYALLPGALLVRPASGQGAPRPGVGLSRADGTVLVAGERRVHGTGAVTGRYSAYQVLNGQQLRERSEYIERSGSEILARIAKASGQPVSRRLADAAGLSVKVASALALDGNFRTAAAPGGRDAAVDISADRLAIVHAPEAASGEIQLSDQSLAGLQAGSLLLGGTRSRVDGAEQLDGIASSVRVGDGVSLALPELMLMATDAITVGSGAELTAAARTGGDSSSGSWRIDDGSALVALSSRDISSVSRGTGGPDTASISIAAGSRLATTGAMVVNTPGLADVRGALSFGKGLVDLGSRNIHIGGDGSEPGIHLSGSMMDFSRQTRVALHAETLSLHAGTDLSAQSLALDAGAIESKLGEGDTARIRADQLTLASSGTEQSPAALDAADLHGRLRVEAGQIELGEGSSALTGFDRAEFDAARGVVAVAEGGLHSADATSVAISAPLFTSAASGNAHIDLAGDFSFGQRGVDDRARQADGSLNGLHFGGQLRVDASNIALDGKLASAAGLFRFNAAQDLSLGEHADLSVAGTRLDFKTVNVDLDAGRIELQSSTGNLSSSAQAKVNISGGEAGDAGSLSLSSAVGVLDWQAVTSASHDSAQRGGRVVMDAQQYGNDSQSGVNTLLASLNAAGIDDQASVRVRQGDLRLNTATPLSFRQGFELAVDGGALQVASDIHADGTDGGTIRLSGRQGVALESGTLTAVGSAGEGGKLIIDAGLGSLSQSAGQVMDVNGASRDGRIDLIAARSGDNQDLAIGTLAGSQLNARQIRLLGDTVYTTGSIGSSAMNTAKTAATTFSGAAASILDRLGLTGRSEVVVAPAVEFAVDGDASITSAINLDSWSFGGQHLPGLFRVRASGDLNVNAGVSDGFSGSGAATALRADESFSYQLVSGADLQAADALALADSSGAIKLGALVRTGTGDIDLRAAGDVDWLNENAGVYSAGRKLRPDMDARFPSSTQRKKRSLPEEGGDVSIAARGNLTGSDPAAGVVPVSDWLIATNNTTSANLDAGWSIVHSLWRGSAAAMGGGDLSLSAGGDMTRISASTPSTAQLPKTATSLEQLNRFGQGRLDVSVGGDMIGSLLMVGDGTGRVSVDGAIRAGYLEGSRGALFGLQGGTLDVVARQSLDSAAIFNPTELNQKVTGMSSAALDSYTDRSAIRLTAMGGTLSFSGDAGVADVFRAPSNELAAGLADLPSSLTLASLYSGIDFGTAGADTVFNMRAAPKGQLDMIARQGIQMNASLHMLDDPDYHNTPLREGIGAERPSRAPIHVADSAPVNLVALEGDISGYAQASLTLPKAVRAYVGGDWRELGLDVQNVAAADISRVEVGGDLAFNNQNGIAVHGPGRLDVLAGGSISLGELSSGIISDGNQGNTALSETGASLNLIAGLNGHTPDWESLLQPLSASDLARRQAFADDVVRYVRQQLPKESLSDGEALQRFSSLSQTKRDAFNSSSVGSTTERDQLYSAVIAASFMADALAGSQPDALLRFLQGSAAGREAIVDAMSKLSGGSRLSEADAFEQLGLLDSKTRLQLTSGAVSSLALEDRLAAVDSVLADAATTDLHRQGLALNVFFGLLAKSGADNQYLGDAAYSAGFRAIAGLFDQSHYNGGKALEASAYDGSISLEYSAVYTRDGGDINLLAPGGGINAGGYRKPQGIDKAPSELGIVAQSVGQVNAFVRDDILVNAQRIFTLGGGDLTLWASLGNIDAGRGKKGAMSAPPPSVSYDEKGNLKIDYGNSIAGSGIRAIVTDPSIDTSQVDVNLIAPNGEVNAGEAGIGSAGVVRVAAVKVVGADNFDVGGVTVGVGGGDMGGVAAGVSGLSGVSAGVAKAAEQSGGDAKGAAEQAALSEFEVDVVGVGEMGADGSQVNSPASTPASGEEKDKKRG